MSLTLTRKIHQSIQLIAGEHIINVKLLKRGTKLRLNIECDPSVKINRLDEFGNLEKKKNVG